MKINHKSFTLKTHMGHEWFVVRGRVGSCATSACTLSSSFPFAKPYSCRNMDLPIPLQTHNYDTEIYKLMSIKTYPTIEING